MHVPHTYDYAIVRVVPRVERGEFVNAGIILSCDVERFLEACIALDEQALLALDPAVDLDVPSASGGRAALGAEHRKFQGEFRPTAGRIRHRDLAAQRGARVSASPGDAGRRAIPQRRDPALQGIEDGRGRRVFRPHAGRGFLERVPVGWNRLRFHPTGNALFQAHRSKGIFRPADPSRTEYASEAARGAVRPPASGDGPRRHPARKCNRCLRSYPFASRSTADL